MSILRLSIFKPLHNSHGPRVNKCLKVYGLRVDFKKKKKKKVDFSKKKFNVLSKNGSLWIKKYFFNPNRVYSDRYELDLSDETIKIQNFHFSRKL